MGVIEQLLDTTWLPKMVKVRQRFKRVRVADVNAEVHSSMASEQSEIQWPKNENGTIAIVVGSRGIAQIDKLTKALVDDLKTRGYFPIIVPGMGSHGGATAEGQAQVLESFGITESLMGAPIRSSMEVVQVGTLPNGLPVFVDRTAYESDGVIVINRIKPHTAFRGQYESGIVKMIAIGLGKQKGAEACHRLGFGHMAEHIVQAAEAIIATRKLLCGVAVLENAYDEVAEIKILPANKIFELEPALLERAKSFMPRIMTDDTDVLIVDEIGKDISGDGMDPNITGRYATPYATGGLAVRRIAVLRLTERTHGNANGLGLAEITTQHVFNSIDFTKTYPNALTSTVFEPVKIPMVLANDKLAIQCAVKTSNVLRNEDVRVVHIRNTLSLEEIRVSESLLPVFLGCSDVEVLGIPKCWSFDEGGSLDFAHVW